MQVGVTVRKRQLAVVAALIVSTASLSPMAAHADSATPTTLYVEDISACSDTGPGTETEPYCTLQAAVDVTVPGDTVMVGTTSVPVTITRSGTAAQPITIEALGKVADIGTSASDTTPVFTVSGASYVTIKDFLVGSQTARMALITGSNNVTLDGFEGGETGNLASPDDSALPAIEIAGSSSDVTVSRGQFEDFGRHAPTVQVDAGSSGDVITTNGIEGGDPAIAVQQASDVDITSNTIIDSTSYACGVGVSISGATTDSYIENNALEPNTLCGSSDTPVGLVSVTDGATSGTTVDYNVLNPNTDYSPPPGDSEGPDEYAYDWGGSFYTSVAAFTAATGQGAHDIIGDPGVTGPWGFEVESDASPVVNSANSDAPGELSTDVNGKSRVNDPLTADTGVGTYDYYDRGAAQIQPSFVDTVTAATSDALTVSATSQTWSSSGYTFDFGDGTPTVQGAYGKATHTYAEAGTYTITVSGTSTLNGNAFTAATAVTTLGSDYTPFGPTRLLDTRKGLGAPKAKVTDSNGIQVKIAGVDSIPSDVTAVALNLTATDTVGNGFVTGEPDGVNAWPSNMNFTAGQTIANNTILPVDSNGDITLLVSGTTTSTAADLIGDVTGYFTQTSADGYGSVPLDRLLDTRKGLGAAEAKVAANHGVSVAIAGQDSIPVDVSAVAVHVTVVDTTGNGWIAAEPDGAGVPSTSILNYLKGQTISNTVIVPVATDGKIELYNGGGTTSVDLLADVAGYFSTTAPDAYVPVTPYRAWDTRSDGDKLTPGSTQTYSLSPSEAKIEAFTIPADATLVTNLTAVDETASGVITAFAAGAARPVVSNLNYFAARTLAGLAILPTTGSAQKISVYNDSTGSTDLVMDVFGYFSSN